MKRFSIIATIIVLGGVAIQAYSDKYFEMSKNLDIFSSLYKELNLRYVDETQPGKLMKTGIDAMLESLDPYTVYYPESDIEDYRLMTTGKYGGIGSLIRKKDDFVIVSEPYEGFPAQKAGMKAGDVIISVDGNATEGKNSDEMSKLLKGQPGTALEIEVQRYGVDEPLLFEVVREEVKIQDVPYFGMLNNEVGYIMLNSFTETASKEVTKAFKDLKANKGMKKLVFDLRGNGGGLLREAVNIVNLFVPKGQEVVSTKGKIAQSKKVHRTLNEPLDEEIPVVILIDGGSASASEIVAGTLQDLDRGVVVGTNSFGKGLVQQTVDLSYNSKMKLTVAKYYTPSGRCIQRIDYSHKDKNGKFETVPDSLKAEFKTKNGRTVYDGAGIDPDIKVSEEAASKILASLVQKNLIFDYATIYSSKHTELTGPSTFTLSDKDYEEFVSWLEEKDYDYTTKSEQLLEDLKKAAEREKYFGDIKEQYDNLVMEISHNKAQDLYTHRNQIESVLTNEIVSRYYYQVGRIQNSLNNDDDINQALEIFTDFKQYSRILQEG